MRKPDHRDRPWKCTVERLIPAKPETLYEAWTTNFGSWFADPENIVMAPEVGLPYFFTTPVAWGAHPHYGRFLELEKGRVVEMTWLTGDGGSVGTKGAETVLRIELTPKENGTLLRLTHSGFIDRESSEGHEQPWAETLEILENSLKH